MLVVLNCNGKVTTTIAYITIVDFIVNVYCLFLSYFFDYFMIFKSFNEYFSCYYSGLGFYST